MQTPAGGMAQSLNPLSKCAKHYSADSWGHSDNSIILLRLEVSWSRRTLNVSAQLFPLEIWPLMLPKGKENFQHQCSYD